ncbi:MAG: tetratricopeptide repeat protein, partial [Deltaproteobacteria bacterium]|nr:tetratricopeptide repeat protein [Deltaproteobacteria bacterium]
MNIWTVKYLLMIVLFFIMGISCSGDEAQKAEHKEKARQYVEKNELRKAVIELKNAVQIDPEDDVALYELGEVYMRLKREDNAIYFFDQAISKNPDNMKAQLRMGQIVLAAKQTKKARKIAKLVLKKSPEDLEALNLLAGVQIQEKNLNAAVRTLKKAASIDPAHFKTHLFLAHLYLSKGNTDHAEKTYLKVIAIDSSARLPYIELARLYGTRGQWEKAESLLKRMVKTPGQKQEKLHDLARFYESRKRWDQAEKTYLEAVDSAPDRDVAPLMNLGFFYARRISYDKALGAMQKALNIQKDDLTILANMAQLHFDFNKIQDAEALIEQVLSKNKDHVLANFVKGRLDLFKKDFTNGLKRFQFVVGKSPRNAMAYYYGALCVLGKGGRDLPGQDLLRAAAGYADDDTDAWERKQATTVLLRVVELNPRMLDARLILAELYLREKAQKKAREQINIALKLAPDHLKALTLQGSLKVLEGDLEGAEAICKKVIELNPNLPSWRVRLGLV